MGPKAVLLFGEQLLAKAEAHAAKPTTPDEYRQHLAMQRMAVSFAVAALRSSIYYHETVVPTGDVALMAMCRDPGGYSDLSALAHAAKLLMTGNPLGLTNGVDMERINRLGSEEASKPGLPVEVTSRAEMARWMDSLTPGEAYMVLIDMDRGNTDPSLNKDRSQSDHWITLGREPSGSGGKGGGRTYLYDPWPKAGSQITFVTAANRDTAFWPYFEVDPNAAGRQDVFKRTIIASSATPKV